MRGLEDLEVQRAEEWIADPKFTGPVGAPRVAVVTEGLGSGSLFRTLCQLGSYQTALLEGIALSVLCQCDVVILPERRVPASLSKQQCWTLWDWVSRGGRLILTHDAVGYRDHPILFPWVCAGGTAHVEARSVDVVWAQNGAVPVGRIQPSYPEHILLQPCFRANMTVIAVDVQTGKPTVSGAAFDMGKVCACGLALGAAGDGSDTALNAGEIGLLKTMLAWLLQG
ncbi:MAG: hypothetical protein ACUVX8_17405 [Candidatus Zipacnadales bacterium]